MTVVVVIRTRDEAPRLRLTLASLEAQPGLDEVIVVDDGSRDETPAVLAGAARRLPLRPIRLPDANGRSGASNRGARAARSDLLIFLDGDTLAAPGFVSAHRAAHAGGAAIAGRGETWHLRATRFFHDPESGEAQAGHAMRVARMSERERSEACVTRAQVTADFAAIARRAAPGIYPGAAPAALYHAEMAMLAAAAPPDLLWAAASGSNFSVGRDAFLAAGGFDEAMDINEHRELAFRLHRRGIAVRCVAGGRSIHLTHRIGWRDPLSEREWARRFRERHPDAPLDRLEALWAAAGSTIGAAGSMVGGA